MLNIVCVDKFLYMFNLVIAEKKLSAYHWPYPYALSHEFKF